MRRCSAALVAAALTAGLVPAMASGQVVISQVNGNGGLTGDPFDRDFVELFNRGSTAVNMAGWSLQIWGDTGSSTTVATPTWDVIPLSGTILPGQYFLVVPSFQRGSLGSSVVTTPLPAPDVMGPVYDGAILITSVNAVALVSNTTQIPAGQCPSGPSVVDFVRYAHPNGQCFEVAAAPPSVTGLGAMFRNSDGCADSDNNAADLYTSQVPVPRNSDTNIFVTTTISPGSLIAGTGGTVTFTARRGPSTCNPITSPLTSATANLAAFGLSATQTMFDNGTNGDLSAGDGEFSYQFNVGTGQAHGTYVIPISASNGATTLPSSARLRVYPPAAANDSCANAISLSDPLGINILTNGPYATTVNATTATGDGIDAGSCNGDTEAKFSVWYSITTGSTAGALRIVESSTEDVVMSVHSSCGAASTQCANREDNGIPLATNTTYLIQIGRETGATQPPQEAYQLAFEFVTAPANDDVCSPTVISSFPFSDSPYAPSANNEAFNIACDATANPGARNGVWYRFVAPTNGAIEAFENSINPTNFVLFSGGDCSFLNETQCRDESLSGALINGNGGLVAGTTYWLLVSYDSSATTNTPTQPYNFTLNFHATPVNDNCDGAVDLNSVGLPHAETVAARYANIDAGAPSSTGGSGFNTCNATLVNRNAGVWYTYTTGSNPNGMLRVADFSTQDVFYNVFIGGCGSLTPDQCYGAFTADDIFIRLDPNTTYYILVSLASTTAGTLATGDYDLTFTFHPTPPNDLPCNATLVTTSLNDFVAGPAATADVDVSCNYNIPAQSTTGYGVWYRFAPTSDKLLVARQLASDVLVYGLFTGPDCNNLTEITCRTGSNANLTTDNRAAFELQGGTQYWLLTGKIASSQPFGGYNLQIDLQEPNGACCIGTTCNITTEAACTGNWRGAFTTCGSVPNYEDVAAAAIPDSTSGTSGTPGLLTRTLNIADSGTVSDIKVLIDINHARVGDLIMTVQSPGGAIQDLVRRIDDDTNVTNCPTQGQQGRLADLAGVYIFDDQANFNPYGPTLADAAAYFDSTNLFVLGGHYQPTTCNEQIVSLNSVFIGQSLAGTWTLTITDNQSSSTGTLNRWGLIVNGGQNPPCLCRADFNNSGAITVQDIFDFLGAYFSNLPTADINGVGGVTVQDIFDYLALYFQGC